MHFAGSKKGTEKIHRPDVFALFKKHSNYRTYLAAGVMSGLLLASILPAAAQFNSFRNSADQSEPAADLAGQENTTEEPAATEIQGGGTTEAPTAESLDVGESEVSDSSSTSVNINGSNTSISVESSTSTTGNENSAPSQPSVVINGQEVPVPKNGRINETYRDEDSTTRIRTRIDSDSSSSTHINVNTTDPLEAD